jgi:hypothetical protein
MARVQIPVTTLSRAGVAPPAQTNADATNNHLFVNNGSTWLEIVSSDAGSQHVDFSLVTQTVDGVTVPPKTVTIAAGATVLVGPWPANLYNQAAVAAEGTITSDGTAPADGDTVVIAGQTYTFKTTLTPTANQVLIGASAATALTHLAEAINAGANGGTDYASGTVANAYVTAGTATSTTLTVTAKTAGTGGNSLATTETSAHLSWAGATLSGGFNAGSVVFLTPSVSTTLKFRAYSLS